MTIEEIKRAFMRIEAEIMAYEGRQPTWTASQIAEVLDSLAKDDEDNGVYHQV